MTYDPLNDCCCGQNTQGVCGDFEEPIHPDLGQCSPYRHKRTCEVPQRPEAPCADTAAYVESRPNSIPKFVVVATIHDENCNPILDENGAPIMGEYVA